jgi:hypothetical protein
MISENLTSLNGKPVKDYESKSGIKNPETTVYRLRVDYDSFSDGLKIPALLADFCKDPNASKVQELVIGAFDFDGGDSKEVIAALAEASSKLSNLKVLFIGDITYEENEISWIIQCDVSAVLRSYPELEYFGIRGGNSLSFGGQLKHNKLKNLVIESGGLPANVIEEVSQATLPNLEHLELWLGSDNYGFSSTVEDFATIINGKNFPKLRYLGLRDSEISDDLAKAISQSTILNQLESLDLSLGTLGDEGAKALISNPAIRKLKTLDLHYHFISDSVCTQLMQLGINNVNLDKQNKADEDGSRYISVAE